MYLVRGPRPVAHARALVQILRAQRWIGKRIFDVFVDAERIDDRNAVVHEGWHHTVGIELEIVRAEIFVTPQFDKMALVGQLLLAQAVANLFGTRGQSAMIEFQNVSTPMRRLSGRMMLARYSCRGDRMGYLRDVCCSE